MSLIIGSLGVSVFALLWKLHKKQAEIEFYKVGEHTYQHNLLKKEKELAELNNEYNILLFNKRDLEEEKQALKNDVQFLIDDNKQKFISNSKARIAFRKDIKRAVKNFDILETAYNQLLTDWEKKHYELSVWRRIPMSNREVRREFINTGEYIGYDLEVTKVMGVK